MLDSIPTIYLAGVAIVFGILGLIWSADRFVAGAATIATSFGIAPMIIGLTIVSFGTSAPEVMVSFMASLAGTGELAIGNALGSNIANIGLVLGVTTIIASIPVQKHILKHEAPVLVAITLIAGAFLYDATLSQIEGWILIALLPPSIVYLVIAKQREFSSTETHAEEALVEHDTLPNASRLKAAAWFVVGLLALVASSKVLVWGAETTAVHFNVSPLIIGLTVIAIGTSLPELAASVMSALKGHHDIAVGNIIGSNLFNLLAVMSIPGTIGMAPMDPQVFIRDYLTMLGITLLLIAIMALLLWRKSLPKIGRLSGIILLSSYCIYMYVLGFHQ